MSKSSAAWLFLKRIVGLGGLDVAGFEGGVGGGEDGLGGGAVWGGGLGEEGVASRRVKMERKEYFGIDFSF